MTDDVSSPTAPDLLAQASASYDVAIRQWIQDRWQGAGFVSPNASQAALLRVLDVHKPTAHTLTPDDVKCAGCGTHVTYTEYPCATVKAIADELGLVVSS